jgi:hypothetical protein
MADGVTDELAQILEITVFPLNSSNSRDNKNDLNVK